MKKQISLFICLILGLSFSGLAHQSKQTDVKDRKVTVEFWQQQKEKSLEKRKKPIGDRPPGLKVPIELTPGVIKQTQKMKEMSDAGYVQPLDFADLAEKRFKGDFVELPMATETYVIDVGGNADETEFSSFSFEDGTKPLKSDSPKFATLKKLADDFDGSKYDLNNPKDRKQMRIRLLRMLNPETQKILEEIADSYQKKFNRPLRITGMARSIDYQIGLSVVSANSFKVKDKESRPPHSSGCAFDIARKQLTAEEQNFIMQNLSEMETNGKIDALTEFGMTPDFHVFVYQDGKPPKME